VTTNSVGQNCRLARAVYLFTLLCTFHVTAGALDREAFTFIRYDLQLHIDPQLQTLSASGSVELRNDSAEAQKNAVLQISSSLRWTAISVGAAGDTKPVQYVVHDYTSDVDHSGSLSEAVVSLPQAVSSGGTVRLQISYDGVITRDTTRLERLGTPQEIAARTDWDQIGKDFTAVRGVGYVCWYPVALEAVRFSEGAAYSESRARWKARESHATMRVDIVDSPPIEMNESPFGSRGGGGVGGGDGHVKSSSWVSFYFNPLGELVPMFFAANYRDLSQDKLAVHYLAPHEPAAKNYIAIAAGVEPFIRELFGEQGRRIGSAEIFDLPYDRAAPYETGNKLFTPVREADTAELQIELAHELTHAHISSPRPWINEGLAHFAQALEREQQAGRHAAIEFMQRFLPPLAAEERTPSASPEAPSSSPNSADRSLVATGDEIFYRTKAMYAWWMLRDMLGDKVLQRALAKYDSAADTEPSYLQRLLQAEAKTAGVSAPNLESFFDDWIYRDRGLPDFRVASTYVRTMLGGDNTGNTGNINSMQAYLLTVTIENLGNAGAEVPVIASSHGTETEQKRLWVPARSKASIRMPLSSRPDRVTVNDGSVPESDMNNNSATVAPAE
jgi:hypothetical protein